MTIKKAETHEEFEQIEALAKKNNLEVPTEGTKLIAVNSKNKVTAFVNMRGVMMIEPFVGDEPNAAVKLWNHIAQQAEGNGVRIMRCFVEPKTEKILKKLGFYRVFKKHKAYEINFY